MKSLTTILFAVLALTISACGPADVKEAAISEVNASNIARLANLYQYHQLRNQYAGPSDEASFREFISTFEAKTLDRMGVDPSAIDDLFMSERDGEAFKIRYNLVSGPHGSSEPAVFEATGVGGKKMVGFLNMKQKEVDAAEADRMFSGEAPKEPASARSTPEGK